VDIQNLLDDGMSDHASTRVASTDVSKKYNRPMQSVLTD